jgi:hypothetical protein
MPQLVYNAEGWAAGRQLTALSICDKVALRLQWQGAIRVEINEGNFRRLERA